MVSSELEELVTSVDRLLIMRRGRVVQVITELHSVDQGHVVAAAAGSKSNED
jgi:ABC-type sugar transport system ATPase subunit